MAEEDTLRNRFAKRAQDVLRATRAGYNNVSSSARDFWRGSDPGASPPPGAAPRPQAAGASTGPYYGPGGGPRGRANPGHAFYGRPEPPRRFSSEKPVANAVRTPGRFARFGAPALAVAGEIPALVEAGSESREALMDELPRSGGRVAATLAGSAVGGKAGMFLGPKGAVIGGLVGGGLGYWGGDRLVDKVFGERRGGTPPESTGWVDGGAPAPDELGVRVWNNAPGAWASATPADRAAKTRASGYTFDPSQTIERSQMAADERDTADGRAAAEKFAAAQDPRLAPREAVAAAPNTAAEARGITRRTTGDIEGRTGRTRDTITGALLNPNGNEAELLQRGINAARFHGRGSPSMRRAIMEAYTGRLDAGDRASVAGMGDGNMAAMRGADNEFGANEAFADRRRRADEFNVASGEERRNNNMRNDTELAGALANARAKQTETQAKRESEAAERLNEMFRDERDIRIAAGETPDQAARGAARALDEGGYSSFADPQARAARTREATELTARMTRDRGSEGFIDSLVGDAEEAFVNWASGTRGPSEFPQNITNPDDVRLAEDQPGWLRRRLLGDYSVVEAGGQRYRAPASTSEKALADARRRFLSERNYRE